MFQNDRFAFFRIDGQTGCAEIKKSGRPVFHNNNIIRTDIAVQKIMTMNMGK